MELVNIVNIFNIVYGPSLRVSGSLRTVMGKEKTIEDNGRLNSTTRNGKGRTYACKLACSSTCRLDPKERGRTTLPPKVLATSLIPVLRVLSMAEGRGKTTMTKMMGGRRKGRRGRGTGWGRRKETGNFVGRRRW